MKERPILFSGDMVRGILEGRKTQTRRIVKGRGKFGGPFWTDIIGDVDIIDGKEIPLGVTDVDRNHHTSESLCPYGQPGDRLWVKENYQVLNIDFYSKKFCADVLYFADGFIKKNIVMSVDEYNKFTNRKFPSRISPGMFMYRSFSRIDLEITDIRVERLQDISDIDAYAEGCSAEYSVKATPGFTVVPVEQYKRIWESINGPGSWDKNPWVWVIEFRRV